MTLMDKKFLFERKEDVGEIEVLRTCEVEQFLKDLIAKFKGMEIVSGEVIEYEIKKSAGNFK